MHCRHSVYYFYLAVVLYSDGAANSTSLHSYNYTHTHMHMTYVHATLTP